jgi:hypothetical protein
VTQQKREGQVTSNWINQHLKIHLAAVGILGPQNFELWWRGQNTGKVCHENNNADLEISLDDEQLKSKVASQ